jgi:hypothetical protein
MFIDTGKTPPDTFTTMSDATYGDFGISVPGARHYKSVGAVTGFISKTEILPDSTKPGSTMVYNDTLQSLGMISGTVRMSGSGAVIKQRDHYAFKPAYQPGSCGRDKPGQRLF